MSYSDLAINHKQEIVKDLKIVIDDYKYSLENWQTYHPGGKLILQQYKDRDATDAFHAFHSKEAHDKLKRMKKVPVKSNGIDAATADYRLLRKELEDEGLFETNWLWCSYKILTTWIFVFLAYLFVIQYDMWLLGSILLGVGYQQSGWLGHDFGHHNIFKTRKINNVMGYFTGNVISGFSLNWWKDRHNTHHAATNVLESDPDIDNLPLFSWTVKELDRLMSYPLVGYFIPYQHYYFPIFTPFLKLIWCLNSILWLNDPSTQNKSYAKSLYVEKGTLVLHWILVATFLFHVPSGYRLLSFFISEGIGGAGIALVVFMNHYACEKIDTESFGRELTFLELQLYTTKNMNPGVILDWICGGLNYQIEHHLFPTIPRNNLSKIRPRVQALAAKHGLPYQTASFMTCFMAIEAQLKEVADAYVKNVSH